MYKEVVTASYSSVSASYRTLQLTIHYEDGTSQTVASDKTWKYDFSPVTFNCIYGGEDYDADKNKKVEHG